MKMNTNINFLFDYDNTIINLDSDYLWNFFLIKINFYNIKFYHINNYFYRMYNNKKINFFSYVNIKKNNNKKLKIIFNYLINIFYNKNKFHLKNKNLISSSTNKKIFFNKKKFLNKYIIYSLIKKINYNEKKIFNIKKIIIKKIITDSINDIFLIYFFKNIIFNPDKILYFFIKKYFLNNFIYI
ncbi:hypothetical protein [Candidatus Carsonella ruddii]|uniref:Uncharacterized protein n=1 Tax=Candidatus Carsonella ruddii CE isolate Thao2000 TaxID=1202536 RepID=J7GVV1_CARRU|nr:hypothetical protein [Candidatus Carsonella ruddii]AFP83506.1 hypothetical protein A33U_032 [Candidatus Carsonella ruddii CE isolate Thao2000]